MFDNTFADYTIYVRPMSTDLRKGGNSLAVLVQTEMNLDPFSKSLFLFCSKSRKILKVLVWDRQGFWEMVKRLESGTFRWPGTSEQALEMSRSGILVLLSGGDPWRKLPELHPKLVC